MKNFLVGPDKSFQLASENWGQSQTQAVFVAKGTLVKRREKRHNADETRMTRIKDISSEDPVVRHPLAYVPSVSIRVKQFALPLE